MFISLESLFWICFDYWYNCVILYPHIVLYFYHIYSLLVNYSEQTLCLYIISLYIFVLQFYCDTKFMIILKLEIILPYLILYICAIIILSWFLLERKSISFIQINSYLWTILSESWLWIDMIHSLFYWWSCCFIHFVWPEDLSCLQLLDRCIFGI